MKKRATLSGAFLGFFMTMSIAAGCTATTPIHFSLIEQGSAAMTSEGYTFAVASNQNDWSSLYAMIHAHRLPQPEPPRVDWSTHMVVFVAAGWKPSAGYRVDISKIEQSQQALNVFVVLTEPPSGSVVATVMTQPYAIAVVEKSTSINTVAFHDVDGRPLGMHIHLTQ